MKILLDKLKFTALLHNANAYIINRKTIMPALTGVLVTILSETEIELASSDLEVYLKQKMTCDAHKELIGKSFILDSKFIAGLLSKLDGETIVLEFLKTTVKIVTEKNSYSVPFTPGEEFVDLPKIGKDPVDIKFSTDVLKNYINKSLPFVASDDDRPVFTGIHFIMKEGKVAIEAATTAVILRAVDVTKSKEEIDIVLPAKFAETYSKVYDGEATNLIVDKTFVRLEGEDFVLHAKLIEGKFPNINQLFDQKKSSNIKIQKSDINPALKRLLLINNNTNLSAWTINDMDLTIESEFKELNMKGKETFMYPHEGEKVTIGLNAQLVIKSMNAFKSEELIFNYDKPSDAIIIRDSLGAVEIVLAPMML